MSSMAAHVVTVMVLIGSGIICLIRCYVTQMWVGWDEREGVPLRLVLRRLLIVTAVGLISLVTGVVFQIMQLSNADTPQTDLIFAILAVFAAISAIAVWRWKFDYRRYTPLVRQNRKPV